MLDPYRLVYYYKVIKEFWFFQCDENISLSSILYADFGEKMMNSFTVIATCFNDEKNITTYLNNVSLQTVQPFEYIIVDGGSNDETINTIKKESCRLNLDVKLISDGRLNISQGYNKAIEKVKTDIIIITGIGNTYDSHFFEALLEKHDSSGCRITYGVTIGRKRNGFSQAYNIMYVGGKRGIHPMPTNRGMLIETRVFKEIGLFNENFIYAGEDVEFYELAKKNRITMAFTDKAVLYWDTPSSFKEFRKQQNVYFVGGLQVYGVNKRKIKRSFLYWGLLLLLCGTAVFFYKSALFYVLLLAILLFFLFKSRPLSPFSILMKLYGMFSPAYHHIKYRKYKNSEYLIQR